MLITPGTGPRPFYYRIICTSKTHKLKTKQNPLATTSIHGVDLHLKIIKIANIRTTAIENQTIIDMTKTTDKIRTMTIRCKTIIISEMSNNILIEEDTIILTIPDTTQTFKINAHATMKITPRKQDTMKITPRK